MELRSRYPSFRASLLGRRTRIAFALAVVPMAALGVCGCSSSSNAPGPSATQPDATAVMDQDSSLGSTPDSSNADDSNSPDAGANPVADGGMDTGADAGSDGGADAGTYSGVTCKTILAANPGAASGMYTIDLDGAGTMYPPISLYCDMTFDGGGWTIIESFIPGHSPADFSGKPGDAGILLAAPQPGVVGGLAGWVVAELARRSTQVHIRDSFSSDAGADGGIWVTSVPSPDAGLTTNVLNNLRNLDVLSKNTDGGYGEWVGPQATAAKLAWVPSYASCEGLVDVEKYPSIYWACGNYTSMDVNRIQGLCTWNYTAGPAIDPIEVYVR